MVKEVHTSKTPTFSDIIKILEENQDLEKITCPKSVYTRISNKYLSALDEMGIEIEIQNHSGAKGIYKEDEKKVVQLAIDGKKPKEISQILQISTKTVYYLISKNKDKIKLDNYKRKYDLNERDEIKSLNYEGCSASKISSMKNIPLRSVYYILNGK
ncbi:MAG: LuxR C-terminal-related transcriptional regulator [archaeon]|nr:LuxR C-terminal-related transcriptional regulator [archaeon]